MSDLDLSTHGPEMSEAYKQVTSTTGKINWVIFGYAGKTNALKVSDSGEDGLEECVKEFNSSQVQYGFVRVVDPNSGVNKFVFIVWQGEGAPVARKGLSANHVPHIQKTFHGSHVTINARTEVDLDAAAILKQVAKSSGANYSVHKEKARADFAADPQGKVGTTYENEFKKVGAASNDERSKYWNQAKEEEKSRAEEEKRKKEEEAKKLETERKAADREAAAKREAEAEAREAELAARRKAEQPAAAPKVPGKLPVAAPPAKAAVAVPAPKAAPAPVPVAEPEPEPQAEPEPEPEPEPEQAQEPEPEPQAEPEPEAQPEECYEAPVEYQEDPQPVAAAGGDNGFSVRALYDYQATEANEISFDPEDIITDVRIIDDGWWLGTFNGQTGMFPSNYVERID